MHLLGIELSTKLKGIVNKKKVHSRGIELATCTLVAIHWDCASPCQLKLRPDALESGNF